MVKIKKDSRKWFFKGLDKQGKKEELPVEWLNGIMSYIETGTSESVLKLPHDFDNGQFPDDNEEYEAKFASNIKVTGNFENNQENIKINTDGSIKINFYPNIAPFKCFKNVTVETDTEAELRLIFKDFAGNIVYNQTTNEGIFDLENFEMGLQTVTAEIMTDTDDTLINNIIFSFDMKPLEVDQLFKGLVKLTESGKIDSNQLDIKYISGAESDQGTILPINPENNNVILPGAIYPEITIDDEAKMWINWEATDVETQLEQMRQKVEQLTNIVNDNIVPYRVGDIFCTTNSQNPSLRTGWEHTKWEAYAQGRVLVGINSPDTDFNVPGKMGGAKTHTLTTTQMPGHNHTGSIGSHSGANTGKDTHSHSRKYKIRNLASGSYAVEETRASGDTADFANIGGISITSGAIVSNTHNHTIPAHNHSMSIGSAGSGGSHNNLQPYVTVYIWRRTE